MPPNGGKLQPISLNQLKTKEYEQEESYLFR